MANEFDHEFVVVGRLAPHQERKVELGEVVEQRDHAGGRRWRGGVHQSQLRLLHCVPRRIAVGLSGVVDPPRFPILLGESGYVDS